MNATMLWVTIAVGELLLASSLLFGIAWFRERAARRRDRRAAQKLVAKVAQDKAEREAAIRAFLVDRFGMADAQLDATAVPLLREEMRFYQTFANLYLQRDADAVAAFDRYLQEAVAPYWQLSGQMSPTVMAAEDQGAADLAEVEKLREQNRQLTEELQITMNTMTRMLNEYSAMFGSAGGTAASEPSPPPATAEAQDGVARATGSASHDGEHGGEAGPEGEETVPGPLATDGPKLSDEQTDALLADALEDVDLGADDAPMNGDADHGGTGERGEADTPEDGKSIAI